MNTTHGDVREEWQKRQQEHGNHPRAVLMKGLHPLINEGIDLWHRDVMRAVFCSSAAPPTGTLVLDLGCGFGRLANEISQLERIPVGIDFTQRFCVAFAATHGDAVCGDQMALPFADGVFGGAYSVTSLMYLERDAARQALIELDRCLAVDGLTLVLEPCREFNELVRMLMPHKRGERLAMPGFTLGELGDVLPANWVPVAAGDCRWLTRALPLLVLTTGWPGICHWIMRMARRLDRPNTGFNRMRGRFSLYRWVACRKST